MAAGEDQAQTIVRLRERGPGLGFQQRELLTVARLPSEPVDGVVPCGRSQPGTWSGWDSVPAPSLQRAQQRVLHDLLSDVEVTEEPRQGRGQAAGLLAEDRAQGSVSRLRLRTPPGWGSR